MKLLRFFELYPIIITALFLGTLIGIGANAFVHEVGHYSLAYAFGSQNIKGFYFSAETVWKEFIGTAETGDYRVEYKSSFPWGYASWQAAIIAFAGIGFQLALFYGIVKLLERVSNKVSRKPTGGNSFAMGFASGLFMSSLSIMWSWWSDVFTVLTGVGLGYTLSILLIAFFSMVLLVAWIIALFKATYSILIRVAFYYMMRKAFSVMMPWRRE